MIPIDFQVSRSKVKVMLGQGGISVSQTSIFYFDFIKFLIQFISFGYCKFYFCREI